MVASQTSISAENQKQVEYLVMVVASPMPKIHSAMRWHQYAANWPFTDSCHSSFVRGLWYRDCGGKCNLMMGMTYCCFIWVKITILKDQSYDFSQQFTVWLTRFLLWKTCNKSMTGYHYSPLTTMRLCSSCYQNRLLGQLPLSPQTLMNMLHRVVSEQDNHIEVRSAKTCTHGIVSSTSWMGPWTMKQSDV